MNKSQRINVARETKSYFPEILEKYGDRLTKGIQNTKFFSKVERTNLPKQYKTKYRCIYGDTLDVAKTLYGQSEDKPCVLNMASARRPGEGWISGVAAQEQQIFFRSTYDMSLSDEMHLDDSRGWAYPIPENGAIYSPDVFVFRENEKKRFRVMEWEDCMFLDFVAVAAVRKPLLTVDGKYTPTDERLMKEKIRNILRVAAITSHKDVLLGAFGCGAFANPPREVARLFSEVFMEPEFIGLFRHLDFAILDGSKVGNFSVFKEMVEMIGF